MARLFDDAVSENLESATVPVTNYPMTLACWMNRDDGAGDMALVMLCTDTTAHRFGIRFESTGAVVSAVVYTSGENRADSTAATSLNTWHHVCGVFTSSTDRAVLLDGANKGTTSASRAPAAPTILVVGAGFNSSAYHSYWSGRIAEVGIWNAALTDSEAMMLASGVSPLRVRRASLVRYYPLFSYTGDAPNYTGVAGTLTDVNTVGIAAHAPVGPMFGLDLARPYIVSAAPPATRRIFLVT